MYEKFFGLARSPFSMTPDPDALFLTGKHREALVGLYYAVVARKGFVVLAGEAGTGKTTLLRKVLQMLPEGEAAVSVVLNPTLTPAEFLELLLWNFGLRDLPPGKTQRLILLDQLLNDSDRAGKVPLLMIDEAHKLSFDVLEEIRLLTNFETSEKKLLQIVLSGQPEIKDLLNRPELWQLKQRVAVRLGIGPLSRAEVSDYIVHRWCTAGGGADSPFSEDAILMIAFRSAGIPRVINCICDNALLLAYGRGIRTIGARVIADVVHDLDLDVQPGEPVTLARSAAAGAAQDNGNGRVASPATFPPEPLRGDSLGRTLPQRSRDLLGFRWGAQARATTAR